MLSQSNTCQCTQCRRQTGSLFLFTHRIRPASALTFTTETSTLKYYAAGPSAVRGFCGECGSFLYWKPNSDAYTCLTIGTIDPLYLFGEGADGTTVPKGGYSAALASGGGHHLFCANDIPGVTDNMPLLLAQGGTRWPGDNE